MTFSRN